MLNTDTRWVLPPLAVLALAGVCATTVNAASALGAHTSLCGPHLRDFHVLDRCFAPRQLRAAERQMPVQPIRPVRAIRRTANLPLSQVELRNTASPIEIRYLFGRIPGDARGVPDLSSPRHRYVMVGELVGRLPPRTRYIFRDGAGTGQGYWDLQANFRCHRLYLMVTSNEPIRLVEAVGRAVLHSESCGK